MQGIVDLHTHTFLSDGVLCPAELARRAEAAGYSALAITDHVDASNLPSVLAKLIAFHRDTQPYLNIRILPGIELTHIPPSQIASLVHKARLLGAHLVLLHGETISEPVSPGTNKAGIEAGVDILAHPGLISEEEVELAVKKGVFLEISARPAHCYANGLLASLAIKRNAHMVLNSDHHGPGDLLSEEKRVKVALGAGLSPFDLEKIDANMMSLVQGPSQTTKIV